MRTSERRPRSVRGTEPEREIVPDWERLADGRPRRLRRGVDFSSPVRALRHAAEAAAYARGKRVLIVGDRSRPEKAVWVQFVDGEVVLGDPCSCGGTRFVWVGTSLVRCASCRRTLIAREPEADEEEDEEIPPSERGGPRPERLPPLGEFTSLRLAHVERGVRRDRYVGFGVDAAGRETLLAVQVRLENGEPIPDASSPIGLVADVLFARTEPFFDEDGRLGVSGGFWDIVVDPASDEDEDDAARP